MAGPLELVRERLLRLMVFLKSPSVVNEPFDDEPDACDVGDGVGLPLDSKGFSVRERHFACLGCLVGVGYLPGLDVQCLCVGGQHGENREQCTANDA